MANKISHSVCLLQFDIKKIVMDLRRQRQGMIQTKVK